MAKPNNAERIYVIKEPASTQVVYRVVPGTVFAKSKGSKPDEFEFRNFAGADVTVKASGVFAKDVSMAGTPEGEKGTVTLVAKKADGSYDYEVLVDGVKAEGNSAPRIIIDG